jgi:ABC-type glycerol-3-phosphate transport system permease component
MKLARALVIIPYLLLATMPLGWLALTSLKSYEDTITTRAKFVPWSDSAEARSEDSVKFVASLDAYRSLSKPVAARPATFITTSATA